MKFYLCHTPEGRKRLVTRQDEAKKLDKSAEPIDIPVDQAGIKTGYEELFDQIFDLEGQLRSQEHDASIAPVTIETPPTAPPVRQTTWTATEIEHFILNEASVAQCSNIFQCLGSRFAELVNREKQHDD